MPPPQNASSPDVADRNIFISWSGAASKQVAQTLRDWLPKYSASFRPWLSSVDIAAGAQWQQELEKALATAQVAIMCLTRTSVSSPWLNFEAGALQSQAKAVIPFLIGLGKIDGPLTSFQAVVSNAQGVRRLVDRLRAELGGDTPRDFADAWKELEPELTRPIPTSYLERYIAEREPPLLSNGVTRGGAERGYGVLLHMFRRERFDAFRAFDLAFHRWNDLLDTDETWNPSPAIRIFDYLQDLFREKRCGDFRRLLVIDPDDLDAGTAQRVLHHIADKEHDWRRRFGANVSTQVLFSRKNDASRERIADLCDFATFAGESRLAIVETTLTSPADEVVESPKCDIVTDHDAVEQRERAFDEFWCQGISIGDALMEIGEAALPPKLVEGADLILECRVRDECVVLIEGGYFDLRSPTAQDRLQHLDHALWLRSHLCRKHGLRPDRVSLEAFLNDLTDERLCDLEVCGFDLESTSETKTASDLVRRLIHERYRLFDVPEPVVFGMKKTRKKVNDVVLDALQERRPGMEVEGENVYLAGTTEGRVLLGYLRNGVRFVPRCTSLIAQHYFDLVRVVRDAHGRSGPLWLFDFNLWTEKKSVKLGAAVAFELFDWPEDVEVNIVNFVYAPGAIAPSLFDISRGP